MLNISYLTSYWKMLRAKVSDLKSLNISDLEVDITKEDKKLFDDYGNKITNSIVAQTKQ